VIRGLALAVAIATAATAIAAWPVLRSPTELIYGHEIAGRHYDAYVVIQQFGGAPTSGPYAQPITDRAGRLLSRVVHPVAAYNLIVLLSFPLTAAATYLLAWYLTRSQAAALIAALAFTFAPPRLAHAAYHPHVVQTQWLALYLLALFALVDRPSWPRALAAAAASGALVLSNFYGGLIGAAITPVAVVAFWIARRDTAAGVRPLVIAIVTMAAIAAAGVAIVATRAPALFAEYSPVAFRSNEVTLYSARWWAYLTPPVDHPLAGGWSSGVFARARENVALVEQQVFAGYALLALAGVAVTLALVRWRRDPRWRPILAVAAIGASAAIISIGPPSGSCEASAWAPACVLYRIAPMFRSYARFAIAVHLALAIVAGAGAVMLAERSRAGVMWACGLLAVAAVEYAPLPWRAHDVLPTAGHRWIARQPGSGAVFDCVANHPSVSSVSWLMRRAVTVQSPMFPTCADPRIGDRLAVTNYAYVVVRRGPRDQQLPERVTSLTRIAEFPDSRVYAVAPSPPPVSVVAVEGFYEYEADGASWRQWMTSQGRWFVWSVPGETNRVSLSMRLSSFRIPRAVDLALDGRPAGRLQVGTAPATFTAGPWDFDQGTHTLTFTAGGPALRPADDGQSHDTRALTILFEPEQWAVINAERPR
jgi:hypothetical protein